MVRSILTDTTLPVRIRPRMETSPVKGHFLSGWQSVNRAFMGLVWLLTDICALNGFFGCLEAQTNILVPSLFLCRDLLSNWLDRQ